mmetsp:Transcript_7769/g.28648  ORF Transcript_7769/g.28648 Transcript_7769/m.28648 type:complete len:602 (+) Transcript_7769:163-1968(+)
MEGMLTPGFRERSSGFSTPLGRRSLNVQSTQQPLQLSTPGSAKRNSQVWERFRQAGALGGGHNGALSRAEAEDLTQRLSALERERAFLLESQQASTTEAEKWRNEVSRMQAGYEEAQLEVQQLRAAFESEQKAAGQHAGDLHAQLQNLMRLKDAAERAAGLIAHDEAAAQQKAAELDRQVQVLERSCEDLQGRVASVEEERNSLSEELRRRGEAWDKKESELKTSMAQQMAQTRAQMEESTRTTREELQHELSALQAKYSALEEARDHWQQRCMKDEQRVETAEIESKKLQKALDKETQRAQTLATQLAEKVAVLEELQRKGNARGLEASEAVKTAKQMRADADKRAKALAAQEKDIGKREKALEKKQQQVEISLEEARKAQKLESKKMRDAEAKVAKREALLEKEGHALQAEVGRLMGELSSVQQELCVLRRQVAEKQAEQDLDHAVLTQTFFPEEPNVGDLAKPSVKTEPDVAGPGSVSPRKSAGEGRKRHSGSRTLPDQKTSPRSPKARAKSVAHAVETERLASAEKTSRAGGASVKRTRAGTAKLPETQSGPARAVAEEPVVKKSRPTRSKAPAKPREEASPAPTRRSTRIRRPTQY